MSKHHGKRSFSIGSIIMLIMTIVVLVVMANVLNSLKQGMDVKQVQSSTVLELSDDLSVGVMDIPDSLTLTAAHQQSHPTATEVPLTPVATQAPTATPTPTATPYAGGSFTLTAGGNFYIEQNIRQSCYYRDSKKYDLDELTSLLSGDITGDLRIATLENIVIADEKYNNLIAPTAAMAMLRNAGFNTVAVGFNKLLEKGDTGLSGTIRSAQFNGLNVIGGYEDEANRAVAQHITTINGVKVAVLHYTSTDLLTSTAKKNRTAIGEWSQPVIDEAENDIAAARQMGAEVVIVSLNWSKKEATSFTKKQSDIAQKLADAGADVILGTGAQNILPMVWLEGHRSNGQTSTTLCCYDLGSLVSDSRTNNGVTGLLLHAAIHVDAKGNVTITDTSYTPTYIWHYLQDKDDHFRIVNSSLPAPDGMDAAQERCKDSALERTPKKINLADIVLRTR